MAQAKKQFSAAAKPRCSHHNKNKLPSRDFEAHAGITGISASYVFPRGISATWYQNHINKEKYAENAFACYDFNEDYTFVRKSAPDPALMSQLQKEWGGLVALNPELKKVRMDRDEPLYLIYGLYGVASQFNPDDINYYLDLHRTTGRLSAAADSLREPGINRMNVNIQLTAGTRALWVASPQTMQKIKRALEAKTGKPIGWVTSPENEQKIRRYLAKKWTAPTDTPEETAEVKRLTEGPFGGAFEENTLFSRLNDKTMRDIRRMLFSKPAKKAPGPRP